MKQQEKIQLFQYILYRQKHSNQSFRHIPSYIKLQNSLFGSEILFILCKFISKRQSIWRRDWYKTEKNSIGEYFSHIYNITQIKWTFEKILLAPCYSLEREQIFLNGWLVKNNAINKYILNKNLIKQRLLKAYIPWKILQHSSNTSFNAFIIISRFHPWNRF